MNHAKKSFPSKYDDELIATLILQYKEQHDGNAPTIRQLSEIYGDLKGLYASTSVMSYRVQHICKERNWHYTMRGVETKGEWKNGTSKP